MLQAVKYAGKNKNSSGYPSGPNFKNSHFVKGICDLVCAKSNKNGKAYLGEKGLDVRAIKQWNVGGSGYGKAVFDEVKTAIQNYTKERIGGR